MVSQVILIVHVEFLSYSLNRMANHDPMFGPSSSFSVFSFFPCFAWWFTWTKYTMILVPFNCTTKRMLAIPCSYRLCPCWYPPSTMPFIWPFSLLWKVIWQQKGVNRCSQNSYKDCCWYLGKSSATWIVCISDLNCCVHSAHQTRMKRIHTHCWLRMRRL